MMVHASKQTNEQDLVEKIYIFPRNLHVTNFFMLRSSRTQHIILL